LFPNFILKKLILLSLLLQTLLYFEHWVGGLVKGVRKVVLVANNWSRVKKDLRGQIGFHI
jgi:hypothetical protein